MQKKNNKNPFSVAKQSSRHPKVLLWGASGTGKTTLALQFPNPVVIDLEKGTELYGSKYNFDVLNANSIEEIKTAMEYLKTSDHDYETLIIDPITVMWELLQQEWSEKLFQFNQKSKGFKNEYYDFQMKDWALIKKEWKDLLLSIVNLNMAIVATAREKVLLNSSMNAIGYVPDSEKNIESYFDIVIRLERQNGERKMGVSKDRTQMLPSKSETSFNIFKILFNFKKEEEIPTLEEQIVLATEKGLKSFRYIAEIPSPYPNIAVEEKAVELGMFNLFGLCYPYEDMARNLIMIKQRNGEWVGSRQYLHKLQAWEQIPTDVKEKIIFVLEETKKK